MKSIQIILFLFSLINYGFGSNHLVLPQNYQFESLRQLLDFHEEAQLTTPELVERYGYPSETHHVETSDGYILEMHRIPYGKKSGPAENKPVVFVQHGLLCSSADWVLAGPEKGLGFLLADLGYDVWMGNARGNTYSKRHRNMSPEKGAFWEFSWHEIGIYDLPAMIDYVLTHTNQKQLFYAGHSQGTTAFFVMCSEKPEYNSKIRAMFCLGPVAYMSNMTSPLVRFMAKFQGPISSLLKLFGVNEFMPNSKLIATLGDKFCDDDDMTQFLCSNVMFILCGFNKDNLNTTRLPVIFAHTPAGASTRQLLHYAQEVNSGAFRQYDYGIIKNMIKYGSLRPPSYDLKKVTAPVSLHYSRNDWMASVTDVLKLSLELPNLIGRFQVLDENFNHLDYLWGMNAPETVYQTMFNLMIRY